MLSTHVAQLRGVGRFQGQPLAARSFVTVGGQMVEGVLEVAGTDAWYPVTGGVPCFLRGPLRPDFKRFAASYGLSLAPEDEGRPQAAEQSKTNVTFSDKWRRFKSYGMEPRHETFLFDWCAKKLGLGSVSDLREFYRGLSSVLEVGTGSGFNTRFIAETCPGRVFGLDISDAAFTTYENTRHIANCTIVQADLMDAPFPESTFDFIVADGVLHHTPDTREALRALYCKVRPGGRIFFYVYRRMGAARQFCDRAIREVFARMAPEQCYAACESLTELGRELSRLGATVTLTKPIDVLGIPAGRHDVQRLLYYHFVKCFWNDAFDYETNNMVNFDWYHPHNAWQHTREEVEGWLEELGCREFAFNDANPNGLSVLLTKPH